MLVRRGSVGERRWVNYSRCDAMPSGTNWRRLRSRLMRVHTPARHEKALAFREIWRTGDDRLVSMSVMKVSQQAGCWRRYRAGSPSRDASWLAARILSGRDAVQHTHGCGLLLTTSRVPLQPLCLEGQPCISLCSTGRARPTTPAALAEWRRKDGTHGRRRCHGGAASLSGADGLQNKNVAVPQRCDPTNLPCWRVDSEGPPTGMAPPSG